MHAWEITVLPKVPLPKEPFTQSTLGIMQGALGNFPSMRALGIFPKYLRNFPRVPWVKTMPWEPFPCLGKTALVIWEKKLVTLLDLCVSSLRRGHANLLCIVPILTDGNLRRGSKLLYPKPLGTKAPPYTLGLQAVALGSVQAAGKNFG